MASSRHFLRPRWLALRTRAIATRRSRPAVAAVLLSASAAGAAPWKLDTEIDGSATKIELAATGELTIAAGGQRSTVRVAPSVSRASLHAANVHGTPTIVVDAGEEAIIVARGSRGWAEVARTKVGPIGPDGETLSVFALDIVDDRVVAVYNILNPDKLARV